MAHSYRPLQFTEFKKYPVCVYPWYKERLHDKYLSKRTKNNPNFLTAKDWTFLQSNNGEVEEIVKGSGSTAPILINNSDNEKLPPINPSGLGYKSTKFDRIYSKTLPHQTDKRNNIDEIELGLIQHPLALFPHLESAVLPEIYEEIVDIVDPEMNLESEVDSNPSVIRDIHLFGSKPNTPHSAKQETKPESRVTEVSVGEDEAKKKEQLTYRWTLKKEEKDRRKRLQNDPKPETVAENEHIKEITREFCDWVSSLGGESNNIEEPTVASLFASGYETKPALSVPIHVIELTSIPPELRGNVSKPPPGTATKDLPYSDQTNTSDKIYETASSQFTKMRYGAWYLPNHLWQWTKASEKLQDPKLKHDEQREEQEAKFAALNQELAKLQSPALFSDFVDNRISKEGVQKCRKPQFLEDVSEIKRQKEIDKLMATSSAANTPAAIFQFEK